MLKRTALVTAVLLIMGALYVQIFLPGQIENSQNSVESYCLVESRVLILVKVMYVRNNSIGCPPREF